MSYLDSSSRRRGRARSAALAVLAITALGATVAGPAQARLIDPDPGHSSAGHPVTVYHATSQYSTPYTNAHSHFPLPAGTYVGICEASSSSPGPYQNHWWTKLHSGTWVNNGYLRGAVKMNIGDCTAPPDDGGRPPVSYAEFNATLKYIGHEIQTNARSNIVRRIHGLIRASAFIRTSRAVAAGLWAKQVRPKGPWDHKPRLERMFHMARSHDYYMDVPGTSKRVFYDIWSNIHYGYVGRAAGFSAVELLVGQNLPFTGKHSRSDDLKVMIGISLYKRFPHLRDLTNARIQQAIVAILPTLRAVDSNSVIPRR